MIPSDHFVRFYNEVFKVLMEKSYDDFIGYWRQLGKIQTIELTEKFRKGGLQACYDYWSRIRDEENCDADVTLTDDYFEFRQNVCPSLAKALDNDAETCEIYCDHCMAWIEPAVTAAGLYPTNDMESRTEPYCVFRIYTDKDKAEAFIADAVLPAHPYDDPEVQKACQRAAEKKR